MNEKALRILEYPKIIERLTAMAGSVPGKMLCKELLPSDDLLQVTRMQRETTAALSRILKKGSVSFSGVTDFRLSIKRLEIGSTLTISELLAVSKLLSVCTKVKSWSRGEKEEEEEDCLEQMFRDLEPLTPLHREIDRCILSEEEIGDDASPGLKNVRRSISVTHDRIRSTLAGMVNGSARSYLQDAVITMRDGRFCLPVKAEHRSMVPGMIHDQSSTGSTLFIEPMQVVRLNNDLRELELNEAKEIEAVLSELSNQTAENADALVSDIEILTELDFIFARAQLSRSYNGFEPDFNMDGIIEIRKGRHPLLDPKTVVPVDIRLGEDFTLLVISGPNTGGKTVSLKTVGLFTLMGQAGLHIPAGAHSRLALFKEVFADIGDEQSIEQSLSTFSSHMTSIVSFWNQADENSLVLFDELGAGTDPTEGAALAIAILSDLHARGTRTIATTHYSELKVFALSTPGIENACCEFDVNSLRPTYRLLIGVPGKSNAFAISRRLGLPESVIDEAKNHISQDAERFEDVVSDLEGARKQVEEARDNAQRMERESEEIKTKLERKERRLEESREKILAQAREEARDILRSAKEYADETIRKVNKLGTSAGASRELEWERSALREKLQAVEKELGPQKQQRTGRELTAADLHLGDSVKVLSLNLKGTVTTLPDAAGNVFVQMGILRSKIPISDLELIPEEPTGPAKKGRTGAGRLQMSKSYSVSPEINLLGKTTDEAVTELDKYLDDACMAHLESVRIVHGKGTGALRKAIHNYLRRQKRVKSFRLGEFGEGDAGVTVVTFR